MHRRPVTHTLRDWKRQRRDFTLVDALPADSFAEGHTQSAISMVSDEILKDAPIVVLRVLALLHVHRYVLQF